MKLTKNVLILFTIILSTFSAFSQNFEISGKVIDEQTQQPLKDVSIQIYGTLQGTVSDKKGEFILSYNDISPLLLLSSVGYEKKLIQLNEATKAKLIFTLKEKSDTLQNVVITQKSKPKKAGYIPNSIIDYSFYGDNVLIISYINYQSKLTILNRMLDTLSQLDIPKNPISIFKDCLGNNHIVYDKYIYQVFYDYEKLQLLYPSTIFAFENYLFPCVAADKNNLYFMKKYGGQKIFENAVSSTTNDKLIDYYYINKYSKQQKELAVITDQNIINSSNVLTEWINKKEDAGVYIAPQETNAGEGIKPKPYTNPQEGRWQKNNDSNIAYIASKERDVKSFFAESILFKEVYSPLYSVDDTIYIFNYMNSKIQCYFAGTIFNEIEIRFHNDKSWGNEMHMDRKTNTFYAAFEKNGLTTLKTININNGNLENVYQVPAVFAEKISVYDKYIYYLRRKGDYTNDVILCRQKIN